MWKFIVQVASPRTCYRWVGKMFPWIAGCAALFFGFGLIGGLWLAPPDYQQGDVYRIIYIHVPAATWSLGVYMLMAIAVIIYWVWKIKVADSIAKLSAPIGAIFTVAALVTGSIWGKPTWGTWWIWDARLTSELILLFIYLGIMALRSAMPEPELAAKVSGILTLVGLVNIPIVHYSVNWWQTLHQGATLLQLSKPTIDSHMLYPLLSMIVAFFLYYLMVLSLGLRYELLKREHKTAWVQEELTMLSKSL
jgi:heme exporter protein C